MSGLVNQMNYASMKPSSVASRPQILRWRADNQSYGVSETIRIEIPTSAFGHHLFPHDSFIEAKFTCDIATQAATIDGNCYSLFSRFRVWHGSQLLEDQQNCGRLWHVLNDIQRGVQDRAEDSVCKLAQATSALGANASTGGYICGLNGLALATGTPSANAVPFSFCLPSGIFGSLATKALPLGECRASSFFIELEVNSANNMVAATTAGAVISNVAITDVYYNAKVAILPPDVDRALIASTGGRIVLPATGYKTEMKTIASTARAFNDKFAYQVSSANAFLFWMGVQGSQNSADHRGMTSRTRRFLSEYQLNINGEAYPSDYIRTPARMLMELMRAYDYLGTTVSSGVLDKVTYDGSNIDTSTTAQDANTTGIEHKRFVAGIDLNRFNQSNDTLMSGTNTIGQSVNLVANFSADGGSACNLYTCLMHDVLYVIQDGLLVPNI